MRSFLENKWPQLLAVLCLVVITYNVCGCASTPTKPPEPAVNADYTQEAPVEETETKITPVGCAFTGVIIFLANPEDPDMTEEELAKRAIGLPWGCRCEFKINNILVITANPVDPQFCRLKQEEPGRVP